MIKPVWIVASEEYAKGVGELFGEEGDFAGKTIRAYIKGERYDDYMAGEKFKDIVFFGVELSILEDYGVKVEFVAARSKP